MKEDLTIDSLLFPRGKFERRIPTYTVFLEQHEFTNPGDFELFGCYFKNLISELHHSSHKSLIALIGAYGDFAMRELASCIKKRKYRTAFQIRVFLEKTECTPSTREVIKNIQNCHGWHYDILCSIYDMPILKHIGPVSGKFVPMRQLLEEDAKEAFPYQIQPMLKKICNYKFVSDFLYMIPSLTTDVKTIKRALAYRIRELMFDGSCTTEEFQAISDALASDNGAMLKGMFNSMKLNVKEFLPVPTKVKQ